MTRKKKSWNMSNPLYRYLHGGKKASRRTERTGGTMARRGRRGRSRSGGRGFGGSDIIDSALAGMGTAAVAKRFIGAPLGTFTGAAAGGAYSFIRHKNLIGGILGGWVHDNIGNVGGASSSGGQYLN
jgi:hypothetical protein